MPLEYEIVKRLKELERLDVRGLQFQPSAVKLMGKIAIRRLRRDILLAKA